MLNRMCNNCLCSGNECKGEISNIYTGCVFKRQATEQKSENNTYRIGISREELEQKNVNVNKLKEAIR
jgi:hypothetical protein